VSAVSAVGAVGAVGAGFVVVATKEESGERLDRVLAKRAKVDPRFGEGATRSAIQRWVAGGRVRVGGAPASADHKVVEGQEIAVDPLGPERTEVTPDASVAFGLLHVDDDLVVVSKPAGLVVHPGRGHADGTLVHGLLGRGLFRAEDVAAMAEGDGEGDHVRPGIVHRIDMETSGVLVVARNAGTREALKALFQAHDIERIYEAIVVGRAEARTYRTLHGRHPTDRLRFTSKVREGKVAVTHVEVVRRFGDLATHVRCRLETGRTHQIRVHLADVGTPILADKLYGKRPKDPRVAAIAEQLGRHALHAGVLGFVHPRSRAPIRFEEAMPADLIAALGALESLASADEEPAKSRARR
jgi:23S rRNA pseudouridine1911/1915/1917 synthase